MSEHTTEKVAWGIVDSSLDPLEWFREHLSFGKGPIHCVWIPEHPKTAGKHPRPDHAVLLAITGNGEKSEANAQRLVELWNDVVAAEKPATILPLWLVRFRSRFAWIWRIGLIKRTTAFRWEVAVAVWPMKN